MTEWQRLPHVVLWTLTRGPILMGTLFVAGISCVLFGTFPMILNDAFLWSLRIYRRPSATNASLTMPDTSVVVFDHPTFFDHAVLMQAFGRPLAFLTNPKRVATWPLNAIARAVGCVPASFDELQRRVASGIGLFVAPDPGSIGVFKTGAFRVTTHVTPVVIHYDSEFRWTTIGGSLFDVSTDHIRRTSFMPIFYEVAVLPVIYKNKNEDEDPTDFANRTRDVMNDARERLAAANLKIRRSAFLDDYRGSTLLMITVALCFFAPLLLAPWASNEQRVGMILSGIAGIAYHATGNKIARRIDVTLRNIIGPIFCLWNVYAYGHWIPMIFGTYATMHYVGGAFTEWEHALLIHLPVSIGLFFVRA